MVLSRWKLDAADKDDIDLSPRYFGRTHDLFTAIPSQEALELSRYRFDGSDAHSKKQLRTEKYQDGVFKTALNLTPIDKPIIGSFDQKDEHNGGPGNQGYALHGYVPGFPDPEVNEPETMHQGGWVFDHRQEAIANFQDIIGIDAIENPTSQLPRYSTRFDWKAGITYIRHDAHFMKEGGDDCVPPIGNGQRKSGRILFTKEDPNCPPFAGGSGDSSESESNIDDSSFVCGEMILDTSLQDHDTNVNHECGEWRPRVTVQPGDGGYDTYDYSWHHPGGGYYGGYGAQWQGGIPTPESDVTSLDPVPTPTAPVAPTDVDITSFEPVPTPSTNPAAQQAQHGWSAPQSPAFSQRVNIFDGVDGKNVVGTFVMTKPMGRSIIQIDTWLRVSDPIPMGQTIQMDIKIGQWLDDEGPEVFGSQRLVLTDGNITSASLKRFSCAFAGLDATKSRMMTVYFERRNDLNTPQVDVEVFVARHLSRFR
jgi:hypothetical protein